ncbi:uncharacterized protein LOC144121761 [Amblyomma americanum]
MALKAHALKQLVAVSGPKKAERQARPAATRASAKKAQVTRPTPLHPMLLRSSVAAAIRAKELKNPETARNAQAHSELDDTPELSRCDGGPPGPSALSPDVCRAGDGASDGDHLLCEPGALDDEYPVEGAPFPSC